MKITKTASGKNKIKMSKTEWKTIGKKAGWTKKAGEAAVNAYRDKMRTPPTNPPPEGFEYMTVEDLMNLNDQHAQIIKNSPDGRPLKEITQNVSNVDRSGLLPYQEALMRVMFALLNHGQVDTKQLNEKIYQELGRHNGVIQKCTNLFGRLIGNVPEKEVLMKDFRNIVLDWARNVSQN